MKRCFKCHEEKPFDEFYRHPEMADGLLGKCKTCTRRDVAERYVRRRDYVREYEKRRFKDPDRKAKLYLYQQRRRERNPEKYVARTMVGNAIRSGRIVRQCCEVCGDPKTQAHHHDYSRPLDVQWLCFKHHREVGHGQKVG